MNKIKQFYWILNNKKKVIGLIYSKNSKEALKLVKGKYAVTCYGNWLIKSIFILTRGVFWYT